MIRLKAPATVRVRLSPDAHAREAVEALRGQGFDGRVLGEWLYLYQLPVGRPVRFPLKYEREKRTLGFRGHRLTFIFQGDRIAACESKGKRLCFFPEIGAE